METLALGPEIPRDPAGQVLTYEGRSIALVDLGRDASDALRASWSTAPLVQSGGVVDSSWLLLMLGAGSTAASSAVGRQRLPGDSQSRDADDHRYRGRFCCHGPDRDRRGRAVRRRQQCPDTGCGTSDALHNRLVGDAVRTHRAGAEDSGSAVRGGGARTSTPGRR